MASKEAEAVAAIAEQNLRKQEPIGGSLPALPLEQGFAAARTATRRIHELLEGLKALKPSGEEVESQARELQKQLLALRRAHRAMIRFAEASKQAEQAARKLTEAEFQAFQTRKYESSVCRSAAGRSRFLATPQLEQLRPLIVGFQEKEADGKVPEAEKARLLTRLIDLELEQRMRLEEQLKDLEQQKQVEQQKLTARVNQGAKLTARMSTLKRAFEPLSSVLRGEPEVKQQVVESGSKDGEPASKRSREVANGSE